MFYEIQGNAFDGRKKVTETLDYTMVVVLMFPSPSSLMRIPTTLVLYGEKSAKASI